MLYLILEIKFSRKSDFISVFTFKSNARETWCVILVSESWHILLRITALYTSFRSAQNHCLPDNVRPRGAFISVGDCTPTEKDLLLLATCRSGSLLDWDKQEKHRYYIRCFSFSSPISNDVSVRNRCCSSLLNKFWLLFRLESYHRSILLHWSQVWHIRGTVSCRDVRPGYCSYFHDYK